MSLTLPEFLLAPDCPAPAPCFVIDEEALRRNASILDTVQKRTGTKILLALKGYAAWSTFPLLSRKYGGPLWGVCASSVDEARLGREQFGGEVHAYAAAWTREEIAELAGLADHIVFNSARQWRELGPLAEKTGRECRPAGVSFGLRVNPEHSEGAVAIYNPCAPGSRLGIRKKNMPAPEDLDGISGLHFHTLCEQGADAFARTLAAFEKGFGPWLDGRGWFNFGGGHHITRAGYDLDLLCDTINGWRKRHPGQVYLEPGEAVALNAGWLTAEVLDLVEADMPVAILNVSAACHMPDVLEMPYRPEVAYIGGEGGRALFAGQPGSRAWTCRLAGMSCLAGDVIGEYAFAEPLRTGQRLAFADMAIYSMVKTTTFNGLRLPSIGLWRLRGGKPEFSLVRQFGYDDFRNRLS